MKTGVLIHKLTKPWVIAVILVAVMPFFPEYVAPILAACAAVAAYRDARARRCGFKIGLLGKLIIIYIVYMSLGVLYSPNILSTLATTGMWIVMFMSYLALTTVLHTRSRLDTFLLIFGVVAGIIAFVGCVQYMLNVSLGLKIPSELWAFDYRVFEWFNIKIRPFANYSRVSSTFNNPNIFAEFMVMALPFIAYYSIHGEQKKAYFFFRFCLMTAAGAIAFTYSRGSYIGLLVIALVFGIANIKKIAFMIVAIISGLLLVPQSVLDRLFSVAHPDNSVSERVNIWILGKSFFEQNPLFGVGAGVGNTWDLLIQSGINSPHMHSLTMQLLVEGGIIALAIFAVIGWNIINFGIAISTKNAEFRFLGIIIVAFSLGFFVCGMFDFPLMTPKLIGMFLTALAFSDVAAVLCLGCRTSSLSEILSLKWKVKDTRSESVLCPHVNTPKQ